ncbi:hypothetical protein JCM17823_14530 [Halorubrum gandharaense]
MTWEALAENETLEASAPDGSRLVKCDDGSGVVLERYEDPDRGTIDKRREYDLYRNAKLHFGLYLLTDGFERPNKSMNRFVPVSVAAEGKPAIAAWLFLQGGYGHVGNRQEPAEALGVSEHTVSRYLTRIREVVDDWEIE